jgi:anion-transporting  ArsA/GET3 family ATPase
MDLEAFCRQSNIVIVVGKGGVGKTTLAATLALTAARAGLRVLLAGLDDSGGLAQLFDHRGALGYVEEALWKGEEHGGGGEVRARLLTSDAALIEYLSDHGLRRVARHLVRTGALEVVATAIPGIREILVLGKLKQLERSGSSDLIVLDAPATGHAVSFLTSSSGLFDAARGGPLQRQAEEVVELLGDARRCQVLLATIPEETPVNEVVETAYRLEDEVGVALRAVVVNACYPLLEHLDADPAAAALAAVGNEPPVELLSRVRAAALFRAARQQLQEAAIVRLRRELPLPQLRLPFLFNASLGYAELDELSRCLDREIEQR